jgi:DNA-binding MarR family transcriptional regulator
MSRDDALLEEIATHPGHLIRRAYQIFASVFDEELGPLGLTPVQFIVLAMLRAHPGVDQTRLAGLAAIDKTSCGRAVERLARDGLVQVRRGAEDRRQHSLALTDRGTSTLRNTIPGMRRIRERLLSTMPAADQRRLLRSLEVFVTANNEQSRAPYRPPER